MRRVGLALVALALVALGAVAVYLDRRLPAGVGLTAKHLCSLSFVSGLPIERARFVYMDPWLEPFGSVIVDRRLEEGVSVRALWRSARAVHRPGHGCTLVHEDEPLAPAPSRPRIEPQSIEASVEEIADSFDPDALRAAVERAFDEPRDAERPLRQTMAVLVQHRGRVVAERYADGVGPRTPLPGWSMTKSVTTTLIGLLVRDGRLDLEAPGALARWRGTDDPRSRITLNQLLRMTSGLDIVEDQTGTDPNSTMLFDVADAAAYAATRPLQAEPGTLWEYMSGSTVLAAHRAQEVLGGLDATVAYLDRELFAPLGVGSAVIEPDQAGTLVGSSFMLASARDWAQLGQLYLDDGVWNGERLLPIGWREYVGRHTESSGDAAYGAGFWLPAGPGGDPGGLPPDTIAMNGFQGQYVAVIPSRELVVVRLGASIVDARWRRLVAEVVAAQADAAQGESDGDALETAA